MINPSPTGFKTPATFRTWLRKNHCTATELVLRCYKVHAADDGVTYAQALDEALCFGWIDGIRRRVDATSFSVRFTPRKARSNWSRVNVAHVERLIQAGRMTRPGLAAFQARDERRTGIYSFERPPTTLAPAYSRVFRANERAWAYFQKQAPWYRRASIFWVMSAKREDTRARRLALLIVSSSRRQPVPPLTRKPPST